jgi:hypothetical protein
VCCRSWKLAFKLHPSSSMLVLVQAPVVLLGLLPLHVQQMNSTNHWLLATTTVKGELELVATIIGKRTSEAAPFLPINRQQESRANWEKECRMWETKRESEGLPRAATLLPCAAVWEQWEYSLSEVILLLHVCCNPFFICL